MARQGDGTIHDAPLPPHLPPCKSLTSKSSSIWSTELPPAHLSCFMLIWKKKRTMFYLMKKLPDILRVQIYISLSVYIITRRTARKTIKYNNICSGSGYFQQVGKPRKCSFPTVVHFLAEKVSIFYIFFIFIIISQEENK